MHTPIIHAPDQPLPAELAGRNHGWFTRYRNHAVFSQRWVTGRWRLWGPCWLLAMLVLAGDVAMAPPTEQAWTVLVVPMLQILLPMATVPGLGLWLRRQAWPAARERQALVAVFVMVMALLASASTWAPASR